MYFFFIDHHFFKWDRELHFSIIEWPKKIMTHGIIYRQMHYVWGWSQKWWGLKRIGVARDTQITYSQNQKINSRIRETLGERGEMREWRIRRREQLRCFATTTRGSSRMRRSLFSTRRPSTSSAMSAIRSSPPPLAWPSTSSRSTRRPSPSTFACHLQFFLRQFPFMCGIVGIYIGELKLGFFFLIRHVVS